MAFSLELPSQEEIRAAVVKETEPPVEVKEQIPALVAKNAETFLQVDPNSMPSRRECVQAVEAFGLDALKKSESKNAILQKRMYQFTEAGGESGEVSKGLADLTLKMKDLDPSKADFLKSGKIGKLFNPVRRYFERFKTADEEIATIIGTLDKGKKTLANDNTTLEIEQGAMRQLTLQLTQNIEIGTQMDAYLENEIQNLLASDGDPDKIKFLQEEVLYPLRQRIQDFQQLLVVNQQGIVAMEIIRRNNKELIRSVDRARLVTVSALRTAVTVAGALYDQKIVLQKVSALNAETNRMIEATSSMLKEQGTEIHRQAEEANLSPDTLINAFTDALDALEEISTYKQAALPRLKDSIEQFRQIADEGERHIKRLEEGTV
ncbi:MAG: toxic anion resistance protein [Clostridia bacterium]|nr:toxic anion resistance protein [Clostridia bacterium]